MSDDKKTPETEPSTALALNDDQALAALQKEVAEEFVTSDREVYKKGLRSLMTQEQQLQKQIRSIEAEIKQLHETRVALDEAFKNGSLQSIEDARGITRSVRAKSVSDRIDRSFS